VSFEEGKVNGNVIVSKEKIEITALAPKAAVWNEQIIPEGLMVVEEAGDLQGDANVSFKYMKHTEPGQVVTDHEVNVRGEQIEGMDYRTTVFQYKKGQIRYGSQVHAPDILDIQPILNLYQESPVKVLAARAGTVN